MEFLKKLLTQTGAHLSGLNTSQRLAIGLCVVIVVGALLWLWQWSAQQALVPLLDQPFTADELQKAANRLDELGASYEIRGDRIYVAATDRERLQGRLLEAQALPVDTSIGFAKLMEEHSPWLSQREADRRWNVALANELAKRLRMFSGIKQAWVHIDNRRERHLRGQSVMPSAVVYVQTDPGAGLDKKRVHALASAVSGAVAGLKVQDVRVVDATTGRSYSVPDPSEAIGLDLLEIRRAKERHFAEKILAQLAFIPGVLVNVFAELETESTRTEQTKLDKPVVSKSRTETVSERNTIGGQEPGVRPNTSVSVSAASAGGQVREQEITEEELLGERSRTHKIAQNTPFAVRRLKASVSVPRSYLVGVFKARYGQDQEPKDDDPKFRALISEQLVQIERIVRPLVDAPPEDAQAVQVSWFYDAPVTEAQAAQAAETSDVLGLVRAYGSRAGLGALALLSLVMMLMMARKASTTGGIGGGPEGTGPEADWPVFSASSPPVGEAETSEGVLVAQELDEGTVRTHKIIDQIGELVRKNPENAANLIGKWIEQDK